MNAVVKKLAEQASNKYYGKYRGFVVDNIDPDNLGRLKLQVPSILGETVSAWALPCVPYAGEAQGLYLIPEINTQLWVEFEAGDLNLPIWTGTFWRQDEIPEEINSAEQTTRLLKTPSGHRLQFDDEPGSEKIILHHSENAEIEMNENGSISLIDAADNKIFMDAEQQSITIEDNNGNQIILNNSGIVVEDSNGNKITMESSGITVEGTQVVVTGSQVLLGGQGGEPLIKGQSFLSLFATHIHTSSPTGGPTTPPMPQGEMSTLSTKVTCA